MSRKRDTGVLALWLLAVSIFGHAGEHPEGSQGKRDAPIRLGLPYPITGPPEIQAADRATRRYRVIAAHAVPPITDTLAKLVADAISLGDYGSVETLRRTGLSAFEVAMGTDRPHSRRAVQLLLAGDDVIRNSATRPAASNALRLRVVEPIALMPFVLLCTSGRCMGQVDARNASNAATLRADIRSLGSAGERSTGHRAARLLLAALNSQALLVTYNGGSTALGAVISGEIDAALVPLPLALGYVAQSQVRALALTSEGRFPLLQTLPTLAELGLSAVIVDGWFALFATDGLPAKHDAELRPLIRAYRLEPASRMDLLARGLTPVEITAAEFEVRLAAERERGFADRSSGR